MRHFQRTAAQLALLASVSLCGCAGMNHAQRGALVGTTVGALGGAIIGHQSGHSGAGAVIGAGAGMMAGTLIGDAEDAREQRDWAMSQVRPAAYQQTTSQPPLSNADLIFMSQNGLTEEVIINAVKSRGGRFDVDPAALVQLKQSGVSDAVIAHIQQSGGQPAGTVVVREPAPQVVYVEPYYPPPPPVGFSIGFGHGPHWHHHHHCDW